MARGFGFLKTFVANPRAIGAVWPSSASLADAMVAGIDWPGVDAVLEYGPGTGAFTAQILAAMRPGARLLAIEQNAELAEVMRSKFPQVTVVEDSAEQVRAICDQHDITEVQAIVCALPWAAFPETLQTRLLEAMMTVLSPAGEFATFAYLQGLLVPAGRRFRRKLPQFFSSVEESPTVFRNFPPAFVYRCRR